MSEFQVRIVSMDPMRVASVIGFGASPEELASKKMIAFLEASGLKREAVRWFGFNNPCPSPGSPNYGYEIWVPVGPEVQGEGEVTIKEIPARRYAVARCEGLSRIGEVWQQLVLWFEASPYQRPAHFHQCLENLLSPPGVSYDEYVFDLCLPIAG